MKAVQLSAIYLCIVISTHWNYAKTEKRAEIAKKDQFIVKGNGSTNGDKTKIFLHVETTDGKPVNPVSGKKLGKGAPKVAPGQPGIAPSATTTPPLSGQVTTPPAAPKGKGKHFQVTPKPPTDNKAKSQSPPQSQIPTPSQSVSKASKINLLSSSASIAASSIVKSPKATPTPTAIFKSSLTNSASSAISSGESSTNSSPVPQSSGVVPAKSEAAASSGSSTYSPLPMQFSSPISMTPSATKTEAIQGSSASSLARSPSSLPAVKSSSPVSVQPSATKAAGGQVTSLTSPGPSSSPPPSTNSPSPISIKPSATSTAENQASSLPNSGASCTSLGLNVTPAKSSPTNSTPTKSPTTAPPFTFSRDENVALAEHNFYRGMHESPPLSLNKEMVLDARRYAKNLSEEGTVTHDSPDVLKKLGQGENLGMVCSKAHLSAARAARKVIDKWHSEACIYDFEYPDPLSKDVAHFTQLVWGASTQLGIGVALKKIAEKNCVFIVARYKPKEATTDKEQFRKNVKKGLFAHSIDCAVSSQKRFFISD